MRQMESNYIFLLIFFPTLVSLFSLVRLALFHSLSLSLGVLLALHFYWFHSERRKVQSFMLNRIEWKCRTWCSFEWIAYRNKEREKEKKVKHICQTKYFCSLLSICKFVRFCSCKKPNSSTVCAKSAKRIMRQLETHFSILWIILCELFRIITY